MNSGQSVLILGVYISSASRLMLLKHLMKLDPETRYPKHQLISQKSHCLVAYSATWGLLGYSGGASSKLNPFIDIGLVMIFFTDIYRSH